MASPNRDTLKLKKVKGFIEDLKEVYETSEMFTRNKAARDEGDLKRSVCECILLFIKSLDKLED